MDLKPMLDAISFGMVTLDRDGRFTFANLAAEQLLGATREEICSRRYSDPAWSFFTLQRQRLNSRDIPFAKVLLGGADCVDEEVALLHPDGRQKILRVHAAALCDESGRITGAVGDIADITEFKKAEDCRERLLAELEAIINSIADGVIIYRPDGDILNMNPSAEKLLGYSEEEKREPLEKRISKLQVNTPCGDPFPVEKTLRRVLQGETLYGIIAVFCSPDGKKTWVSCSAAPIRTPEGELIGAVCTFSDITSLRALQQQREDYLHTISHDLRIPLTVIRGNAELLAEAFSNSGVREDMATWLGAIQESSRKMTRMIDDLVDAASLEGGPIRIEKKEIDLKGFFADLLRRSEKGIDVGRIHSDMPAGLPSVPADEMILDRVVTNLLSNALKYSPPDTPVRLSASILNHEMVVSVSDRGQGISPEELPSLFNRFFRTRQSRKIGGVGLGLYLSKLLIEAHGGRIWAKCEAGKGCTFSISLPLD